MRITQQLIKKKSIIMTFCVLHRTVIQENSRREERQGKGQRQRVEGEIIRDSRTDKQTNGPTYRQKSQRKKEKERERESVCACVRERKRERERVRERERST